MRGKIPTIEVFNTYNIYDKFYGFAFELYAHMVIIVLDLLGSSINFEKIQEIFFNWESILIYPNFKNELKSDDLERLFKKNKICQDFSKIKTPVSKDFTINTGLQS